MLAAFKDTWSREVGRIDAIEHRIGVTQESRPFCSTLNQAGLKSLKLDELEIKKQLKAKVSKSDMSEWASPVFFVPKKTDRFDFL